MKKLLFVFFVIVMAASGCDSSAAKEVQIQVPSSLNPQARSIITATWPKVLRACPGFRKYGHEMVFQRISPNLDTQFFPGVEVVFQVAEQTSDIPLDYRAFGQTCGYEINPAGNNLRIQKSPCVSICLDRSYDTQGRDFNQSLR